VRFNRRTATHSFIAVNPFGVYQWREGADPVADLRRLFGRWKARSWKGLEHFTGGAVGVLSYDLARKLEPKGFSPNGALAWPGIVLLLVRDVIVYDHKMACYTLVTHLMPGDGSFRRALEDARSRLQAVEQAMRSERRESAAGPLKVTRLRSNLSRRGFERMVRRAKRFIRAGDIYQANLSQRFSVQIEGDPLQLYGRLREINPSPFSSFLDLGELQVVSCSPERLIRLRGRRCETRPIAGTRPRGSNARATRRLARELLLHKKERAEHLMLLDLERNDLGRVCDYESVQVEEMMVLEAYSHVIHIVSKVSGKLARGKDGFDLLRAVFPGGTITGCPKIRSMQIIDQLEPGHRGLYTGSIGYMGFNGDMDWNIVIRTLILLGKKGSLQVGAGIVQDSVPRKEYAETLHKAGAFLEALGVANGRE
jgi:anthranilate/para-aminobenzoate synthase component I